MAVSTDYLRQMQALLPIGAAWPREDDAVLTRLLAAAADELARVDARSVQLMAEADPRTTVEILADWERNAGLPDLCVVLAGQTQGAVQRRAALASRLTQLGGQSVVYFTQLAAAYGYTVSISEFKLFRAGASRSGDQISNGDWIYAWKVSAPLNTVVPFRAGQSVSGDAVAAWGNKALECIFARFKPAHTNIIFTYQ